MQIVNIPLLKNPANWFVVWTMLALWWFAFRVIQRNTAIGG